MMKLKCSSTFWWKNEQQKPSPLGEFASWQIRPRVALWIRKAWAASYGIKDSTPSSTSSRQSLGFGEKLSGWKRCWFWQRHLWERIRRTDHCFEHQKTTWHLVISVQLHWVPVRIPLNYAKLAILLQSGRKNGMKMAKKKATSWQKTYQKHREINWSIGCCSVVQTQNLTYLPHKAVAEVSRDKEPIGRGCVEFKWFESRLMSDSSEVRFKWFGLSSDLGFKRFGCQSTCVSNDLGCLLVWALSIDACFKWFWLSVDLRFKWCGCQLIWDSSDSVVNSSKIQMIWMSIDLRFKWVGCQLIWDSSDLDVNRFEIQMSWLSIGLRFKWFGCQMIWGSNDFGCQLMCDSKILSNEAFVRDLLQKRSFEDQKRSISARLPSKLKLWSSKTKLFCETSFKNEALKIKSEAFLRDFLQNWNFEAQKRSFSARLPSKMKLWSSKTKLLCETSFKNGTLTIKNEAFLRDFLQKWHVDQMLDLRIPIRFSDFQVHASKVLRLPRKSWAEAYEVL